MSCSIKVLWGEKGICCILFRIVVRLEVRDELRVLKVLIKMRVFPQMYMGFLEMKNVLLIGCYLSLMEIPGVS